MGIKVEYIVMAISAAMLAAGCAASRQTPEDTLTVSPAPCSIMPDASGEVPVDFRIGIPENYLGRRERVVILPKIMKDTVVLAELKSIAVDAPVYVKKMHRLKVLEGYEDSYSGYRRAIGKVSDSLLIMYRDTAFLPGTADGSRIKAFVTSDGCGSCKALDTLDLGGITDPGALLELDSMKVRSITPKFVIRPKIREGRGEAILQFRINRSDIDFSIGRNKEEMDKMLSALQPVVTDTLATLSGVSIYGMASADGSLAFNTRLAESRATSARNWLTSNLDGLTSAQRRTFKVGSRPEGWLPVLRAMTAAGDKDSVMVKDILEKYADSNDDVQERYIRRLPCWNTIKARYLQKDRKVEYVYTYTIRSFTTDGEMLQMYNTRPDAFNEEELLRVSTLQTSPEDRMEVYRTILHYYPDSGTAANNLAIMLWSRGEYEAADEVLSGLTTHSPESCNTSGVVKAALGDTAGAMETFGKCDSLPESRYNLGILKAAQKDYAGAYALLEPFGDLNAAILAICIGKYAEADACLDSLDDMSPKAEYARAMAAAGLHEEDAFFTHLDAAVRDEALYRRAETDALFDAYRKDARFKVIMGEEQR